MNDPVIHAAVGAQFGDLEFDVGKSVRWLQWFSDFIHVTDVNLGDPRYWIVDWSHTFPHLEHNVVGINFFAAPVEFRKKQWELYQKKFYVEDEDWVLWVDASEGLSFDINSLPDDYTASPFRSWVYREVHRAEAAGKDRVVVPFFVFCSSNEIQNIEILGTGSPDNGVPNTQQAVSVPYYVEKQGLTRLIKVVALRNPDFDWKTLDQPSTPDPGVKMQVISYSYAHWQYMDIVHPNIGFPPLEESNDLGFKMRKQISRVRPFDDFLYNAWNPHLDTPVGLPGPWCTDIAKVTNPDLTSIVLEETPHTLPDASMAGLMTPLYDTVFRLNLRDGLWYQEGSSGNIPLVWDSAEGKWITNYNPILWRDDENMANGTGGTGRVTGSPGLKGGVASWDPFASVGAQPYGEGPYGYGPYGGNEDTGGGSTDESVPFGAEPYGTGPYGGKRP